MVAIIDNYDSFTFNLVHIVNELTGQSTYVVKNDEVDFDHLNSFEHIILSPGPGIPDEAGLLKDAIRHFYPSKKILGVCLGLQAMGEVFGARLLNLNDVYHGMRTLMHKTDISSPIFDAIPDTFYAGRYHSWVIDSESDLSQIQVTAVDDQGQIMAIQHADLPLYGVQFHPESIMTDHGSQMIKNFLSL